MLIGELSKRSGLSRDTIRFYEKQGLIDPGKKENQFNNYKEYTEETFQRLQYIKRLKQYGFTLNESSDLLQMLEADEATCQNMSHKIDDKVLLISQKIEELLAIRQQLLDGKKKCLDKTGTLKTPDSTCPTFVL